MPGREIEKSLNSEERVLRAFARSAFEIDGQIEDTIRRLAQIGRKDIERLSRMLDADYEVTFKKTIAPVLVYAGGLYYCKLGVDRFLEKRFGSTENREVEWFSADDRRVVDFFINIKKSGRPELQRLIGQNTFNGMDLSFPETRQLLSQTHRYHTK